MSNTPFNYSPNSLKNVHIEKMWIECAKKIGIKIVRGDEAYASYDGSGNLMIGEGDTLDDDDSLAQLIFHELCHFVVQGTDSSHQVDWGLDCEDKAKLEPEYMALDLQAALSNEVGLFEAFQPTTEHRAYYLSLGKSIHEKMKRDLYLQKHMQRTTLKPFHGALQTSLRKTFSMLASGKF